MLNLPSVTLAEAIHTYAGQLVHERSSGWFTSADVRRRSSKAQMMEKRAEGAVGRALGELADEDWLLTKNALGRGRGGVFRFYRFAGEFPAPPARAPTRPTEPHQRPIVCPACQAPLRVRISAARP